VRLHLGLWCALLPLVACAKTKRERCAESENHVSDIVTDYWLARPEQWCFKEVERIAPGAPIDSTKFVRCRLHMMSLQGQAALRKFARIGTEGAALDVCVDQYKDAFIECRLDAQTFDGIGACDHLQP
jgi:hypothetical protein